ncbi:hypothetical protein F5Y16DRAFT_163225 [Xylariaceae sp. FL0255]|nr:hypothetical protein F5Y16DRAFT_163225 [Xylariaceae sp. FL0255]
MSNGGFTYSTSNFDDPVPLANKFATIYGVTLAAVTVSLICILLRLHVRFNVVKAPGWDDALVILYLFTITVVSVTLLVAVHYGLGQHFLQLDDWQVVGYLKTFYAGNAAYTLSTTLIKLSLLCQYLRVFEAGTIRYRIAIGLMVLVLLWGTAYSILAFVPCSPVHDFWYNPLNAKCWGFGAQYVAPFVATFTSHAASNMILDTTVFLLPVSLLSKDSTTGQTRRGLYCLFLLGSFTIAFATGRLASIVKNKAASYPTRDPTWYAPASLILATLEINTAAICASIPIFWPVITSQWGKIFVTREVNVTHEPRPIEDDEDGLTRGTSHSRSVSDNASETFNSLPRNTGSYYKDVYVMAQVDPLRGRSEQVVGGTTCVHVKNAPSREWVKL